VFICVILCAACAFAGAANKYEAQIDAKANPDIDFSKLDLSTVTVFSFEKTALCGDDVMAHLNKAVADVFIENNIPATFTTAISEISKKSEFALEAVGTKTKGELFKGIPTDLVISGELIRAEPQTKRFLKTFIFIDLQLFIYSKSLDQVIYKVHFTEGMPAAAGGYYKYLYRAVSLSTQPFFDKLAAEKAK